MTENKTKILNQILTDLKSNDSEKVLLALDQLRKKGQKEVIEEILQVYLTTSDNKIKKEITTFLFDIKNETAVLPIIKAINDVKYKSIKAFLVSIFWQSSLDASEHLNTLIRIAVKGDFEVCLEVLTVIENFDSTFDEEQIMDAIYDIDEAMDDADEVKYKLLNSIKDVVRNLAVDY